MSAPIHRTRTMIYTLKYLNARGEMILELREYNSTALALQTELEDDDDAQDTVVLQLADSGRASVLHWDDEPVAFGKTPADCCLAYFEKLQELVTVHGGWQL